MSQNGSSGGEGEPAFNAPWPALLITAVLIGLYAWQTRLGDPEAVFERFALLTVEGGAGWRLLSFLFVHGHWPHVLMNAFGALAFGSPVSRLFGTGPTGATVFFAFYLACGVFSGWAYLALKHDPQLQLIGASGAVSGLFGAASRLMWADPREGRLAPLLSGPVLAVATAFVILNLLVAAFGFAPGSGGAPVAWEAHLFGYAAGLLLVGPTAALLRAGRAAH